MNTFNTFKSFMNTKVNTLPSAPIITYSNPKNGPLFIAGKVNIIIDLNGNNNITFYNYSFNLGSYTSVSTNSQVITSFNVNYSFLTELSYTFSAYLTNSFGNGPITTITLYPKILTPVPTITNFRYSMDSTNTYIYIYFNASISSTGNASLFDPAATCNVEKNDSIIDLGYSHGLNKNSINQSFIIEENIIPISPIGTIYRLYIYYLNNVQKDPDDLINTYNYKLIYFRTTATGITII